MEEEKKVQFNILISSEWKDCLERIARVKSYHMDKNISAGDLVREAIWDLVSGSLLKEEENKRS